MGGVLLTECGVGVLSKEAKLLVCEGGGESSRWLVLAVVSNFVMGDNEDEMLCVSTFDDNEGDIDDDELLTRGKLVIIPPLRLGNESCESEELKSEGDGIRGHEATVVTVEWPPVLGDLFMLDGCGVPGGVLKSGSSLSACDTIVLSSPFTWEALVTVFTVVLSVSSTLDVDGRASTLSTELLGVSTVTGAPLAEVGISTVNNG